jgi:hypothetical protein
MPETPGTRSLAGPSRGACEGRDPAVPGWGEGSARRLAAAARA